jgi:flagellar biosynthesis protein FlhF
MRIRKFEAASMREALSQVKKELGADAMVVATRPIRRGLLGSGVEVTAALDDPEPPVAPGSGVAAYGAAPAKSGAGAGGALSEADIERIMAPLRSELRSLRSLVRAAADAGSAPDVRSELQALRQLVSTRLASDAPAAKPTAPELGALAAGATLVAPSEKRVVALVGPTGVGKTTTIAKLAARAALVAREKVAIITLDTYRVGGEEQIRTYADLMGVPLTLVASPDQLGAALAAYKRRDRVFIDTAGRSPRDGASVAELEQALAGLDELEVHLCMPAATSPGAADSCFRRYRRVGIDRLLFTKLDEADDPAELVRTPVRLERPVSFVTTGQRVPEDLEEPSHERLLGLAINGFLAEGLAA